MNYETMVAFDIGSTIIHPDFSLLSKWCERKTGISCSIEKVEKAFHLAISGNIHFKSSDDLLDEAIIFFNSCKSPSDVVDEKKVKELWEEVVDSGGVNSWLYKILDPEAEQTLLTLKSMGCKLVAASNSDGSLLEELQSYNLDKLFDNIIDSELLGTRKPNPSFYKYVLEKNRGGFSFHIGDDLIKDCIVASACGFERVLLYDRAHIYPRLPDLVKITKLSDVVLKIKDFYNVHMGR